LHELASKQSVETHFEELVEVQTVKLIDGQRYAISQLEQKYQIFWRKYAISLLSNNQRRR
jgi:hypothetical protein